MYFLIPEDAPHEYAGSPMIVEFAVDEDESFYSASDASGCCLVGGELSLDQPLEDGKTPVRILKVNFWRLINRHDLELRLLGWLLAFFSYGWLMLITCKDPLRIRLRLDVAFASTSAALL
jgi:hypothetical protein